MAAVSASQVVAIPQRLVSRWIAVVCRCPLKGELDGGGSEGGSGPVRPIGSRWLGGPGGSGGLSVSSLVEAPKNGFEGSLIIEKFPQGMQRRDR